MHGQTATFSLPYDTTYTIRETNSDGYSTKITKAEQSSNPVETDGTVVTGTLRSGTTITVNNTLKRGHLNVAKIVVGNDTSGSFDFTLTLTPPDGETLDISGATSADGASQETVDGALRAMTELAQRAVQEAEIESKIRAKGFIDCVVYITDGRVSVTVAAEDGLTQSSVAKITDIVMAETGLTADKLTVTEIKKD